MTKTLKNLISLVLALVVSYQTWSQTKNFTLESDYIETSDEQTISITSTLRKDGNNLIWTKEDGQRQRITFFAIVHSNEAEQNPNAEDSTLTYYLEANGLEGELNIKTMNTEAETSDYEVTMKTTTFLGRSEDFTFHLINFTLK